MLNPLSRYILKFGSAVALSCVLLSLTASAQITASGASPSAKRVIQIDNKGLESLLKPKGRPLLVNFWATWCDPCREEFPELVKLDAAFRGKVDVVTVSLDDLADINGDVPKFLAAMKADMPAYLLKTPDESAAIRIVSKDWAGNLPLTVFLDASGNVAYQHNGKIRFDTVKENIDRVLGTGPSGTGTFETIDFIKIKDGRRDDARYYYENNWRFFRDAAVKRGVVDSYEYIDATSEKDAAFDIILITRYRGEEQFRNSEKGFEPIIKELTPNGPFLRGTSKPDDFRQVVSTYTGKAIFSGGK
ncbi:MAG: redoxin domain-containing protein [Acidobacteriota bacterium]